MFLLGVEATVNDGPPQILVPQRLGDVIIHTGGQALIAVAFECVGGEGDDGDVAARLGLALANRGRGLQPIHRRHLNVHQYQVKGFAFPRLDRGESGGDSVDGVPPFV